MRRAPLLLLLLCLAAALLPWHAGPLSRLSGGTRAYLTSATPAGGAAVVGEPLSVSFDRLEARDAALAGRRVILEAYAVPVATADGALTRVLLVRDAFSCCFGEPPAGVEGWVLGLHPRGLPIPASAEVRAVGVLEMAPRRDASGAEAGLYTLRLERLEARGD